MRKLIDIITEADKPVFGKKKPFVIPNDPVIKAARERDERERRQTRERRVVDRARQPERRSDENRRIEEEAVSTTRSDEVKAKIEMTLKTLGIPFVEKDGATIDSALHAMVGDAHTVFDIQFSKSKSRARDVLTEIARDTGYDLKIQHSTQARDGSTWLHCTLSEGMDVLVIASARDASRHRDHPDFGSYLYLAVKTVADEAKPTKYAKEEYTDTEQRECVKVTSPAGKVVYDGPKALFHKEDIEEGIDSWEQKGHGDPKPVGNLPDKSAEEIEDDRADAAKRVRLKREARAKAAQ